MALLQDIINRNKQKVLKRGPGGVLTEETPEEIQKLSGQAGLQAPPTTPLGGAMVGANADQQKMMGTPAQKQGAIQMAVAPEQDLATAQRRLQPRDQATAEEQAGAQKSEALKSLGSLGDRVSAFMEGQRQAVQAASQPAAQGVAVGAASQFQGRDVSDLKDILGQLRADPSNMQLQLQINQALGYDINRQLDPAEVDQLYEDAVTSISKGTAGVIDDDLTVSDMISTGQFGYTREEISDLLGMTPEEAETLTVGQIKQELNRLQDEEFSKTQELERKAGAGELGVAERGLARQQAREMSRTGVRSTEKDVQALEDQIANSDEVSFGGQTYRVDDLLKDETISGIVADYMNAGPDSEIRRNIDQNEPALKAFIEKNQALLADASKQLQAGTTGFREIQESNKQLTNFGGIEIDPTIAKRIIPGFGELRADKVDVAKVPLLGKIADSDPQTQQRIGTELNAQMQKEPGFEEQLSRLDREEWDRLNIEGNGEKWRDYKQMVSQNQQAQKAETPEQIVQQLFSGIGADELEERIRDDHLLDVLGGAGSVDSGVAAIADANGDGRIDDWSDLRTRLQNFNPQPDLKTMVTRGQTVYKPHQVPRSNIGGGLTPVKGDGRTAEAVGRSLMGKLGEAARDGNIGYEEMRNAGLDWSEMLWLEKNRGGGVNQNALNVLLTDSRNENTNRLMGGLPKVTISNGRSSGLAENLAAMKRILLEEDERTYNRGAIEDRLNQLRDLIPGGGGGGSIRGGGGPISNTIEMIDYIAEHGPGAQASSSFTDKATGGALSSGKSAVKKGVSKVTGGKY